MCNRITGHTQAHKKCLHLSHLDDVRFWPGMAVEIKQIAGDCEVCRTLAAVQQKETLISIESTLPVLLQGQRLPTHDRLP